MKKKQNEFEVNGDVIEIKSSNTNDIILIDKEDYDKIKNYCWSVKEDSPIHRYARARERGTQRFVLMHRIITGEIGVIDHLNHKTLDNRKENLLITDQKGNMQNHIRFAVKGKGVNFDKTCPNNPWRAMHCQTYIGWYATKELAEEARKQYLIKNNIYMKEGDYYL